MPTNQSGGPYNDNLTAHAREAESLEREFERVREARNVEMKEME